MAQTREYLRRSYPLPAYNFRVTVGGTAMSFAEVTGVAVEHDSVTYRHGLSFWEGEEIETFYYDSYVPVKLERGVILGKNPLFLYEWLKKEDSRSLEISLCDETGTPLVSWRIARAVPTKLEAPVFDAKTNDVSIERLELRVRRVSLIVH